MFVSSLLLSTHPCFSLSLSFSFLIKLVLFTPPSSQVSILDAAAVGEVLETFPVCSNPIKCIAAIPEFDDQDPDTSKWMQFGVG